MEWYEVEVVTLPDGWTAKVQRTGVANGVRVRLSSPEAGIVFEAALTEAEQAEKRLVTDEMLVSWALRQHSQWRETCR